MTIELDYDAETLDCPMGENDAGASTIREYLQELLITLLAEEECFSGKRPFGNSGWLGDLAEPLVKAGLVKGQLADDGEGGQYLDGYDEDALYKRLKSAVRAM